MINKYFDNTAPIYRLAICNGYEKTENKYRNQGSLVPNIISKDERLLKLAPPIDHEFSVYFLYPDINILTKTNVETFKNVLETEEVSKEFGAPFISNKQAILDNINIIVERYPNVVKSFINNLDDFINDVSNLNFTIDKEYLYPFSSFDYEDFKNDHYFSNIFKLEKNNKIDDKYTEEVLGYIYDTSISLRKILNKKLKNNSKLILENGKI